MIGSPRDRLKELIKFLDMGQTAFEEQVLLPRGHISKLKATSSITYKVIEKIKKHYPNINSTWLLTGEGEMFKEKVENNKPVHDDDNHEKFNTSEPDSPPYSSPKDIKPEQSLTMQVIANLVESNKALSEAHKLFAEADLEHALNTKELIALAKTTAQNEKDIQPAFDARYADLLELLADVAAGKRYKNDRKKTVAGTQKN